jgi:hypothetical protein
MKGCSLLNDILGPVMRGPSSSLAAAPYAIARTCRELSLSTGAKLIKAIIRFDLGGSFARVHEGQGSDDGFAAGLLAEAVDAPRHGEALRTLRSADRPFEFAIETDSLPNADHPNLVELELVCRERDGTHNRPYRKMYDHVTRFSPATRGRAKRIAPTAEPGHGRGNSTAQAGRTRRGQSRSIRRCVYKWRTARA